MTPQVAPPVVAETPSPVFESPLIDSPPVEPAGTAPFFTLPTEAAADTEGGESLFPTFAPPAAAPGTLPVAAPEPSYAARVRKARRRGGGWVIPVFCGGILIAAAAGYWWFTRESFTGTLDGVALGEAHAATVVIFAGDIDVPAETRQAFLEALANQPLRVATDLAITEFRGTPQGLEIRLRAGPKSRFVRVETARNDVLAEYYALEFERLNRRRLDALRQSVRQMCLDWAQSPDGNVDLTSFRDSVALGALVGGLGYHVAAVVDQTVYPCADEDDHFQLYFLIPAQTKRFVIKERDMANSSRALPIDFAYTVRVLPSQASQDEPATPAADEALEPADSMTPDSSPAGEESGVNGSLFPPSEE